MKILIVIMALINGYLGGSYLLNLLNVLSDTKYSKGGTAAIAVVFSTICLLSLYLCFIKKNLKLALWLGIGPWMLGLVVIFIVMITSKWN
jgi:hypothetical protein